MRSRAVRDSVALWIALCAARAQERAQEASPNVP